MAVAEVSGREARLADDWLRVQGVEGPERAVHPDDDMYRGDVLGVADERRLCEYLRSGHEALGVLRHVLAARGRGIGSLLEFACGYGRLVRWLVRELEPERVEASDVLRPAVDFVRATFGVRGFYSDADPARVPLERRYDAIWVGSLFSHLPRRRFVPLLERLVGALEPEGVLVFTTHTPTLLPAGERDPSGFTFRPESESRALDPGEYGATFVEPAVVAELARGAGARTHACVERGLWRIQDVHVAARAELPALAGLGPAPSLRGAIAEVRLAAGHLWIGGWVRVPRAFGPVAEVSVVVDGTRRVDALFRAWTDELSEVEGGPHLRQTDWYVEGPAGELGPGEHTLVAVARTEDGLREAFDARLVAVEPAT